MTTAIGVDSQDLIKSITRNQAAEFYAKLITAKHTQTGLLPDFVYELVNILIIRNWSHSGLTYIKEKAWKIVGEKPLEEILAAFDSSGEKSSIIIAESMNEEEPKFTINIDELKENGWTINEPGSFPFLAEKDLTADKEAEERLKLVIHTFYNSQQFALLLPDGTTVNIGPYTIDELNLFERMILSVEAPY